MGPVSKRALGAIGAFLAPILGQGYDLIKDNSSHQGWANLYIGALSLAYLFTFLHFSRPELYNQKLIETCLRVFLDSIGFSKQDDVRCVMWVPHKGGTQLKPACRYVPSEEPVKMDSLPISAGIVGLAFRQKKEAFDIIEEPFENRQACQGWLVSKWGFTQEQAKRAREDRSFYAAVPVLSGDSVMGVIYFDCGGEVEFETAQKVQQQAPQIALFLEHILKKDN